VLCFFAIFHANKEKVNVIGWRRRQYLSPTNHVACLFARENSPNQKQALVSTHIASPGLPPQQPRFRKRVFKKERIIMMINCKRNTVNV
jgi:protein-arginine kinase